MREPREFWISAADIMRANRPAGDIHVIEYSAYAQLLKQKEIMRDALYLSVSYFLEIQFADYTKSDIRKLANDALEKIKSTAKTIGPLKTITKENKNGSR